MKKFQDRKRAIARIWTAIQPLAGTAQTSESAAKPKKPAEAAKSAKAKTARKATPAKKGGDKAERSIKRTEVIEMMKRAKGVTLAEIMEVTQWQAHTVRGFVSILGSKGGETIESSKNAAGERTYKITK